MEGQNALVASKLPAHFLAMRWYSEVGDKLPIEGSAIAGDVAAIRPAHHARMRSEPGRKTTLYTLIRGGV
jgi:hypothetical protein